MGTDHAVGFAVLKMLVAALLVANLGFYAWSRGWIDGGAATRGDREPDRLARQVRPESIRILPPAAAETRSRSAAATTLAAAPSSAPTPQGESAAAPVSAPAATASTASAPAATAAVPGVPLACLQSGPFTPAEVPRVEAALQAALPSPASHWTNVKIEAPGIWLVYMGKFTGREALKSKVEELGRFRGLVVEEVRNAPELEPGLSLGRYDSRTAAEAALTRLSERGVRTARVVALSPPATVVTLRFERADPALKAQLLGLPPATLAGTGFVPCPPMAVSPAASAAAS